MTTNINPNQQQQQEPPTTTTELSSPTNTTTTNLFKRLSFSSILLSSNTNNNNNNNNVLKSPRGVVVVPVELSLIQKYENVLQSAASFEIYSTKHRKQLRTLIRQGIPQKLRPIIWKLLTTSNDLTQKYTGLYEKLVNCNDNSNDNVLDKINKDIHRTYPQHDHFKSELGQRQLYNILKAYSLFDKQVGYVQGMAFLAGFILMHVNNEEESFWLFVQLLNNGKYGLKDLFRHGLPRLKLLLFSVDRLVELRLPRVYKHLQEEQASPEMYASNLILTLCTTRFKHEVVQRIWDIFMNESWKIILRMIVGLMKCYQKEILELSGSEIVCFMYEQCGKMTLEEFDRIAFSVKLNSKTIQLFAQQYEETLPTQEQELITKSRKQRQQLMESYQKQLQQQEQQEQEGKQNLLSGTIRKISTMIGSIFDNGQQVSVLSAETCSSINIRQATVSPVTHSTPMDIVVLENHSEVEQQTVSPDVDVEPVEEQLEEDVEEQQQQPSPL